MDEFEKRRRVAEKENKEERGANGDSNGGTAKSGSNVDAGVRVERLEVYEPPEDPSRTGRAELRPEEQEVFQRALNTLNQTGIPYLLAGAFAKHAYTGIWRNTKDLDIFLKAADLKQAFDALSAVGFETCVKYKHWLAKAESGPEVVDLIFGIGHGRLPITEDWFVGARLTKIAGVQVPLIPIEELIAAKVYVADRYRFDGSDVVHLIQGAKGKLDWQRILRRLGDENREVLLWDLILFDFVYPGHADYLPQELMTELFAQARQRWSKRTDPKEFRGTLLDPWSYLVDVEEWGYHDERDLTPLVDDQGELVGVRR